MKHILSLITVLTLVGCGSVLPKGQPSPTLYTLNAAQSGFAGAPGNTIPFSLRILMPQATPGLETDQIALRKDDNQIDYYSGVKWSGMLTSVVQSSLVQSFDRTAKLNSVSNDLVAVNQDYSLLVEIQDFQIEQQKGTVFAHVRLTAKLIHMKSNKIVTTSVYEERQTVGENNMRNVVKAFDAAYQQAASGLIDDVLKTLEKTVPVVLGKKK